MRISDRHAFGYDQMEIDKDHRPCLPRLQIVHAERAAAVGRNRRLDRSLLIRRYRPVHQPVDRMGNDLPALIENVRGDDQRHDRIEDRVTGHKHENQTGENARRCHDVGEDMAAIGHQRRRPVGPSGAD